MEIIRLGDVEIYPVRHCLCVGGEAVHVEPKVMAVLMVLVSHAGEVVTRQALLDTVWAGRVVGEEVLTRCVSELRSALGDRAVDPEFIQTVPKQGYRLLKSPGPPALPVCRRRILAVAAAGVLALAAVSSLYLHWVGTANTPIRIAVLPFEASEAERHFGAGIAEELMNTLVGLPELRVSSRTAAFTTHPGGDPKVIGDALGVDALVTGSLRRSQEGFRMSVQLVEVESGDHLWARTFQGPAASLYSMQDQIVAAVTETLGLPVDAPLQVARTTTDIDALDLYLLGRLHWHERTVESLTKAGDYFSRAIALDPEMSGAYTGLADTYLLETSYGDRDPESAIALAGPLIDRALVLEPNSAEAHASRGLLLEMRHDYEAAEAALARAVTLSPHDPMAHMWRGNTVMSLGRLRDAFEHYETAFTLDPQHPAVTQNYLHALIELGEHERAQAILSSSPPSPKITEMAAQLAMVQGDWAEVERLARSLTDDQVTASLILWRLEVNRQNFARAESHLANAVRSAPDDERVYLAALEHQTLTANAMQFHGVLSRWERNEPLPQKLDLTARAWHAIGQVNRGEMRDAAEALLDVLSEFEEVYPTFRMKLMSHLLVALEHSGQTERYEQWRDKALAAIPEYLASGWGSWAFQVERGYLLAAAGETERAMESFRAAGRLGDLSTLRLSADPRLHDATAAGALSDFI